MDYISRLKRVPCGEGTIVIMWIGQAGFVIKNSKGDMVAIDVYLSDLAEKQDGNKRLTPAIVTAEQLDAGLILASHNHTDHLDLESLPVMLQRNTELYCSTGCCKPCEEANLPMEKVHTVKEGDSFSLKGFKVQVVFADHGDASPDAVGFLIETEGIRIYFTGDTSYQYKRMMPALEKEIDVLLVPINGEYGNMNETDAAMLAKQSEAKLTIPCHFWTFARHQGSPYIFELAMNKLAPEQQVYVMAQGEIISYSRKGK